MCSQLIFWVVRAIDHVNHVIADQFGQVKRMQTSLKGIKSVARVVDWARALAEKAFEEANTYATAKDKLGTLSAEKDLVDQALALEKIGQANTEFALA